MISVLVACESSQAICIEFRKLGIQAWSCDLLECDGDHPEWHLQGDVRQYLTSDPNGNPWTLMIAHPPCTFLTVSANRWLKDQPARKSGVLVGMERRAAKIKAAAFFLELMEADIPYIAVENPIGTMSTLYRRPDQTIQPWMFGDPFQKATCLWLKNLPKLVATNIVAERKQAVHLASPSADRWKIRSVTYPGVAKAIAEQWSKVIR